MQELHFSLPEPSSLLLVRGSSSFILAGRAGSRFPLCIEYTSGELCFTVEPDELIAVSAPEGGEIEPAVMLLELVRRHHLPLLVLPAGHQGTRRLKYVVSAGPGISLSCGIQRGTHPEQTILCSSTELDGLQLSGVPGGICSGPLPAGVSAEVIDLPVRIIHGQGEVREVAIRHPDRHVPPGHHEC